MWGKEGKGKVKGGGGERRVCRGSLCVCVCVCVCLCVYVYVYVCSLLVCYGKKEKRRLLFMLLL